MNEYDNTQAWRENVIATLADIKAQLGRLASDRESEKETLIRVTAQLHAEDRRNSDRLDAHVKWNDDQHEKIHEKNNKLAARVNIFTGIGIAMNFILVAVSVFAVFFK